MKKSTLIAKLEELKKIAEEKRDNVARPDGDFVGDDAWAELDRGDLELTAHAWGRADALEEAIKLVKATK